jgi:hypothetical protein
VSIVSGMAPWRLKVPRVFPWDPSFAAQVSVSAHPAAWEKYGEELCNFADGLLAFRDSESRGTQHLIEYMQMLGKPVHVNPYIMRSAQ